MATQTPLNVPIRPWVPRWLGIVTAFTVMLPIILINGAYTGTITEVSGTLGVLSEDISMAYYATSAGMAVAYPLIPKVRPVVTTKTILLIDLLLQVILSFICAQVNQMDIIIVCSFFIGFLKGFAMLEIILMILRRMCAANFMLTSTRSCSRQARSRWRSRHSWPITTNGSICITSLSCSC